MPTTYSDQFFILDPYSPPPAGTAMNFVPFSFVDENDDGDIDRFNNDSVNGFDITSSWPGDTVTINVGGTSITYTGTTFYLTNGTQVFTPTDGQVLQNGILQSASGVTTQGPLDVGDLGPPCFVAGTLIETERGMTAIQDLAVGDLVRTLDNGLQPVRWHGARAVPALDKLAPIRFAPGAFGNDKELLLSPQHKVLVSGWRAELFFGQDEVFVAAQHLVNHDTIHRAPRRQVTYHHLMFDAHEVLLAHGVPTESFYPGDYILGDVELRGEIEAIFPETIGMKGPSWSTARTVLRGGEAQVLCGDNLSGQSILLSAGA